MEKVALLPNEVIEAFRLYLEKEKGLNLESIVPNWHFTQGPGGTVLDVVVISGEPQGTSKSGIP